VEAGALVRQQGDVAAAVQAYRLLALRPGDPQLLSASST
jgi:hypothetical protein